MGINTPTTGSFTISTTPVDIVTPTSTAYAYWHIKIFLTYTLASTDSIEVIQYSYDPVATAYVRQQTDTIDYAVVGSTPTAGLQSKVWEMNPTPGQGVKLTVTKLTGVDGTANYEIIKIT
jgi:hypothetical protein